MLSRLLTPPLDPPDPPWLFMYILSAISPAFCTADSLLDPDATLPCDDWLSNSLLAWLIAMPINWLWLWLPPDDPDENIFSACMAAAEPMPLDVASLPSLWPP